MKATIVGTGWGAIIDEEKNVLLPKVFASPEIAQQFLDAAERSGVSLYVGMPLSDMQSLFGLWYDAWKRETAKNVDANAPQYDATGQKAASRPQ